VRRDKQLNTKKILALFIGIIICILLLLPIYAGVMISLSSSYSGYTPGGGLIPEFYFQNYIDVWSRYPNFLRSIVNSTIIGIATMVIGVSVSTFGGYTLSRYEFRFRKLVLLALLSTQMFAIILTLVPLFIIMRSLNLINNYLSVAIVVAGQTTTFSLWFLSSYFKGIPFELEEQAMVDGCSRTSAIIRVILPISAPGIAVVAIYNFINAWGAFLVPLVLFTSYSLNPAVVEIYSMASEYTPPYNMVMTCTMISTIPILVLFLLVQRWMVAGLASGALK